MSDVRLRFNIKTEDGELDVMVVTEPADRGSPPTERSKIVISGPPSDPYVVAAIGIAEAIVARSAAKLEKDASEKGRKLAAAGWPGPGEVPRV